ncbi:hypothetical protein [Actinomadura sp. SCN-SB]|uniref:hypothetical protein n=1 Tax=Actinomadura sp. SCN-SB TaxID=3373092 RepID=UPI003750E8B2
MYCSTCGDERDVERPPCPDGHGSDCPERACVACGAAILVGLPLNAPPPVPVTVAASARPTASGAPRPERAASLRAVA